MIVSLGNSIAVLGIPWFVLETTGSAGQVDLVVAATVAPAAISPFIGGALTDRTSHRQLAVLSDVLTVATIPALYLTVGLSVQVLNVLVLLGALFDGPAW